MGGFGGRTDQRIDPFEDSPDYLPLLEDRFGCVACLGRLTKLRNGRVIFSGMKSSPWFWTGSRTNGTPIQITQLPRSDGEKRETIRNLGCQPLCRSMNRFVSTQSPSSAIPRDLLPCGATSNLDGMTATNSRSRPPANSRLMVSRQTFALVTATVTAIPRSALVPGSLDRCGLRTVCRTASLLGVPMYISASVASQRD